ncbi:MAG TPA: cytochrome o ubiquinol oxidase subunit IV [Candidatus Saccharibacteria bacterium]|nr:cytochrome o ubiquinol oxidase subunit IV [Candidatus Saccharibacteria bacterium]HRQ97876.1 cytochrome o ubiquinol oxidase subunit IV [Candidatus Saccharibacteria bacterium]
MTKSKSTHVYSIVPAITGYVLALSLTLTAYFVVVNHWYSDFWAMVVIFALAITQLVVQLVFFLHFGKESRPRWNLTAFWFMLIFLIIIVAGSIWIMNSLNYNMMQMTPEQMDLYMQDQSGAGF